jgi:hypothetical protein
MFHLHAHEVQALEVQPHELTLFTLQDLHDSHNSMTKFYFFITVTALYLMFGMFGIHSASAQPLPSSQPLGVTYRVSGVVFTIPNRIEFDVMVVNMSQQAVRWANGTAQIGVSGISFRALALSLETTNLPLQSSPNIVPRTGYTVQARVNAVRQALQIAVLGPDDVLRCVQIPAQDSLLLGRFTLNVPDNLQNVDSIRFAWLSPSLASAPSPSDSLQNSFQASAFKVSALTVVQRAEFGALDNVPLVLSTDAVQGERFRAPEATLRSLSARYVGDRAVQVRWLAEVVFAGVRNFNAGFVVRRGTIPLTIPLDAALNDTTLAQVRFTDTVADFRRNTRFRTSAANARSEFVFVDSNVTRNKHYAYELRFVDASGGASPSPPPTPPVPAERVQVLGVASAPVPNAIISLAQASPNPVQAEASLQYTLEDRVRLSIRLYSLEGRLLQTLVENAEQIRGDYTLPLAVAALPRGSYTVVLTADALNDASAEASRAVVKLVISQ